MLAFFKVFGQLSEADSLRTNILLNASGNLSYGNVDRQIFLGNVQIVYRSIGNTWAFKTQNNYRYGNINGRLTENDFNTQNYVYYKPDQTIYPYLLSFFEQNKRLKIDRRFRIGSGITYRPLRSLQHLLKFSATVLYETNTFDKSEESEEQSLSSIEIYRLACRIFGRHQFKKIDVSVFYEAVFMYSLSAFGDMGIVSELGVDINVFGNMSVISRINYLRQDLTVQDIKQDDLFITYGFNYQFKSKKISRNKKI